MRPNPSQQDSSPCPMKPTPRRMDALRRRVQASTSPRAYEQHMIMVAQKRADEAAGWRPGEPYDRYAARAAELLPDCLEQVRREWPEQEPPVWTDEDEAEFAPPPDDEDPDAADPPEPPGPRIRTLKDGSWT